MATWGGTVLQDVMRMDYTPGPNGPYVDTSNQSLFRHSRVTSPKDTPDYARRRAMRLRLPMNEYHLTTENVTWPNGYPYLVTRRITNGWHSEYFGPTRWGTGSLQYLKPSTAINLMLINQLKIAMLNNMKGQNVHLGNFFAQRNECLDQIVHTARSLTKAIKALRRGDILGACEALACPTDKKLNPFKSVASNWLALQYGWLPLISDLYGVTQELSRKWEEVKALPPIMSASAKRRYSDTSVYTGDSTKDHKGATADLRYIYDVRGVIHYTVDVEGSRFLSRVGLVNPLEIAWEVLPYSFVVDWFLPVGNWLSTFDATLGCSFLDGTYSSQLTSIFEWKQKSHFVEGILDYTYDAHLGRGRWFEYDRTPATGFPVVFMPQPKSPFSRGHAVNALSLLTQAFFR